jgi:hypothetical protein
MHIYTKSTLVLVFGNGREFEEEPGEVKDFNIKEIYEFL